MALTQKQLDSIARMDIREVVELYFSGLNERDRGSIARCFWEDADIRMYSDTESEAVHTNGPVFADHLVSRVSKLDLATHTVANTRIDLAGDSANIITHVITTHVRGEMTSTRGIRYVDEFACRDGDWRILKRRHWVLWQFDAPLTAVTRPGPPVGTANKPRA